MQENLPKHKYKIQITFIRHAESTSNAGENVMNDKSIGLSDNGVLQAQELAESLVKSDLVVVSRYDRTMLTATPYIDKHAITQVQVSPFLHEYGFLHPKRFLNINSEDEARLRRSFWINDDIDFDDSFFDSEYSNSESFRNFATRVHNFIMSLHELMILNPDFKRIKVFTHGYFLSVMYMLLTNYNGTFCASADSGILENNLKAMKLKLGKIMIGEAKPNLAVPNASIHRDFNQLLVNYWKVNSN